MWPMQVMLYDILILLSLSDEVLQRDLHYIHEGEKENKKIKNE